ncbi:LysR family transcriptional regulator [Ideonella alba]|uniref:LysR family transcriptional regulator n=1 Tax=Ideonella alba TaxID=2824118 RepID=A0A940YE03_9BURK|nr:LysR family transcriptional regulator [Ideonella alba]MBQ0933381.1 LysR family transcriptional regulator [Ideonella alba]
MNTRFLETLVVLARVGSFRETAQVLNATQAAISQRIANLEDDLGVELVDRSQRRLTLTAAGEQAVRQAQRMLDLERELRASTRPEAPPAGRVRLGAIESVVRTWLSPLVRLLAERHPQIDLDITVDTAKNLHEALRHRKLDLMVQNDPYAPAVGSTEHRVTPLCEFALHWIARPELAPQRGALTLAQLERVPLLTFSRTSSPQAHVRALFADRGTEPRICNFPSVESIIQLVRDGYGIAAIPPVFVGPDLDSGALRLCEGPALPAMTITTTSEREAPPAVRATQLLTAEVVARYCAEQRPDWVRRLDA